jgi:hypothetical protein
MVDGQPVRNWKEALEKILGLGEHLFSESDMSFHVIAARESRTVFTAHDPENNPLKYDRSNPLWVKMNKERLRVSVEICYCSTLGECGSCALAGWRPAQPPRPVVARLRRRLAFSSNQARYQLDHFSVNCSNHRQCLSTRLRTNKKEQ